MNLAAKAKSIRSATNGSEVSAGFMGATWVPTNNVQHCHWMGLRGNIQEHMIFCAIKPCFSAEFLCENHGTDAAFGIADVCFFLPVTRSSSRQVCNPRRQNIRPGAERHAERLTTHCLSNAF